MSDNDKICTTLGKMSKYTSSLLHLVKLNFSKIKYYNNKQSIKSGTTTDDFLHSLGEIITKDRHESLVTSDALILKEGSA